MHFTESDALKLFSQCVDEPFDNTEKTKKISIQMMEKYTPMVREALEEVKPLYKDQKEFEIILENAELYIKDAEKLSVATSMGNINLVLRSVVNSNLPTNYKSITSDISISDTLRVANRDQKVESNGSKLANTTLKPTKRRVKRKRARAKVTVYKGGVPTIEYFPIK